METPLLEETDMAGIAMAPIVERTLPEPGRARWPDRVFRAATAMCAGVIVLLLAVLIVFMVQGSMPAFREHGIGFILSPE